MKRLLMGFFISSLFPITLQAQQLIKYHVYVIATNGKVVDKTFASSEELNQDKELRALQIGSIVNNTFAFTPNEAKHKALLVEEINVTGEPTRSYFQAWDNEAAVAIQKNTGTKLASRVVPQAPPPALPEKMSSVPSESTAPKSFEASVLEALTSDKIIPGNTKVSIKLTRHHFFVNEIKQPESTHQKYLKLVEAIKGQKLSGNFQFHYSLD